MLDQDIYSQIVPVLSEGLHFNKLSEKEYILSNSQYRHYLKINSEVFNLIQLIDGKKTLSDIASEYFGATSTEYIERIHTLLYKELIKYGILHGFDDEIKKNEKPNYLKLSFIIFNENIVARIVKHFHFLFRKKVAISVLFFCISIITIALFTNFDIYKSFDLRQSIFYFIVIMAVSVTFHEFGHAAASSYYGARHGGIGGGFYLFTPVYFADVSDVWRLPKFKRVVVNIAGMYFELIFCSLLTLLFFISKNQILLLVSLIVCLRTLFNLNPLIRSDGYWIVSDLMNKPNLLAHGLRKIKDIFLYVFNGKRLRWQIIDIILLFYGIISYTFVGALLYYVVIRNPNSVIYFPKNLYLFVTAIFVKGEQFSAEKYADLIIPLIFYMLIYNLLKEIYNKRKQNKTINQ